MPSPSTDLANAIAALADDQDVQVNVLDAPPSQLSAPTVFVRPEHPWMELDDDQPFGRYAEHYAAVAVLGASDPPSAIDTLRVLARLIRDAADELDAWYWRSTSGINAVEDSGTTYLTVTVRVTLSAEG